MECEETRNLIHAYLDGELDLVHSLEIDRHLESCQACADLAQRTEAVRTAVQSHAPRFAAPAELIERLRDLSSDAPSPVRVERRARPYRWEALASAAVVIAVMAVGWSLMHAAPGESATDRMAMELYSNHIRSLMPEGEHLMDVASTDKHTVKPWFAGKIDFSPRVEDLKEEGFPLTGGRLDLLDGRPVAALVYKHGPEASPHIINLFIQPLADVPAAADEPRTDSYQGYRLISWRDSAMRYWAVSDLNREELDQFVGLLKQRAADDKAAR
ncbi:MAG TPA: anti-sigma factor [Pirellulales bacterium]|nr:anti-sigma factor [Pirellulales bacterium]